MTTAIAIGALIAAFGAIYLIQTVIGKTANAVDRKVRAGTYQRGQAHMRTGLRFTAPAPPTQVLGTIVTKVNAHPSAPALVQGLFVKARTADSVVFAMGNKLEESMTAVVECEADGDGTSGTFAVLRWLESGASVAGSGELTKVRARIAEAVRQHGGSVEEFTFPAP